MKLCFKILLCFFVVLSLGFLVASNDSLILDGNVRDEINGLLSSDGSVTAKQINKDVELRGNGRINLTLHNGELVFKVCESCMGTTTVCYESVVGLSDPKAAGTCFESSCKVEIKGENEEITFGGATFYKKLFTGCITSAMNYEFAKVISSYKTDSFKSCKPKIVGADKMVKLFVNIDHGCSLTVTNAKIHAPPAPLPLTVPPPTQSSQKGSAEASSFPDWGYAIIGIVILIVIVIIGFVVYYLYRKRQTSSKRIPPNVDRKQPKSTKAKDATLETATKKDDDLEAAKVEPEKSQKKEKKAKTIEPTATEDILAAAKTEPKKSQKKEKKTTQEPITTEDIPAPTAKENLKAAKIQPKKFQKKEKKTTQEPTTAEDVPAPPVKQPEPTPSKQLPQPNPAACYPLVRRLIPRGMKSAKTDSLDETLKKDKTAMTESFVVSAGKQCLKSDETDVLLKMKAAYPKNIHHVVLPSEVNLLCLPVSKMYEKIDSMAQVCELKLSTAGCEFDEHGCILSVSDEARQLLKSKTTDATTVYFAFGAEFHEHITDECNFSEASIPLLYVIALQTRFSETSRRKACAMLRRKLVKVLGYFKAADRANMPFPINIVEAAYCKDPKYFYDPTGIKTDSGSDEKKKQNGGQKRTKKH